MKKLYILLIIGIFLVGIVGAGIGLFAVNKEVVIDEEVNASLEWRYEDFNNDDYIQRCIFIDNANWIPTCTDLFYYSDYKDLQDLESDLDSAMTHVVNDGMKEINERKVYEETVKVNEGNISVTGGVG